MNWDFSQNLFLLRLFGVNNKKNKKKKKNVIRVKNSGSWLCELILSFRLT